MITMIRTLQILAVCLVAALAHGQLIVLSGQPWEDSFILQIAPDRSIDRAVVVYSEPSHTRLASMVDSEWVRTADGRRWFDQFGKPTRSQIVTRIGAEYPLNEAGKPVTAQVGIDLPPSTDTHVEAWALSTEWEHEGQRMLLRTELKERFAVAAYHSLAPDGPLEVRSHPIMEVRSRCEMQSGEILLGRLRARLDGDQVRLTVDLGPKVDALRVYSEPSHTLLADVAREAFRRRLMRDNNPTPAGPGTDRVTTVEPSTNDPVTLYVPKPPRGDHSISVIATSSLWSTGGGTAERELGEIEVGDSRYAFAMKIAPNGPVTYCCEETNCSGVCSTCYTRPTKCCGTTIIETGGTCCAVFCGIASCASCI